MLVTSSDPGEVTRGSFFTRNGRPTVVNREMNFRETDVTSPEKGEVAPVTESPKLTLRGQLTELLCLTVAEQSGADHVRSRIDKF